MEQATRPTNGRKVVAIIFAVGLSIAAVFGYFIGIVIKNSASGIGIWIFQFRPTPILMATYGVISVSVLFGIIYALMQIVSKYDSNSVQ